MSLAAGFAAAVFLTAGLLLPVPEGLLLVVVFFAVVVFLGGMTGPSGDIIYFKFTLIIASESISYMYKSECARKVNICPHPFPSQKKKTFVLIHFGKLSWTGNSFLQIL